ncbi:MAG: CAP domain-containing protein [Pseudomonadota bacterium]
MSPDLPDIAKVEAAILEMTNAYRAEVGRGAVALNVALQKAARQYADYLARAKDFSHTADGREPGERAKSAGYQMCAIAENLSLNLDSRGFESRALARQAVEGWINSPGHRDNLVAPHVTEIGIAVVRAPDAHPKFVTVQLLGRPQSLALKFQISNGSKRSVGYTFAGERHELPPHHAVTHETCEPGWISFEAAAQDGPKTLAARYEARDGLVYTLKEDAARGIVVDVAARKTVR